jgi:hypothetical protein
MNVAAWVRGQGIWVRAAISMCSPAPSRPLSAAVSSLLVGVLGNLLALRYGAATAHAAVLASMSWLGL